MEYMYELQTELERLRAEKLKLLRCGAVSDEHSSSELQVIWTTHHRVDSYFLHFTIANLYPNLSI